jgi:hypothetical protein
MPHPGSQLRRKGGVWRHTRATSRRPRVGQGNFHPPNTAVFCLELLYQLKCSFYGGYFDVFQKRRQVIITLIRIRAREARNRRPKMNRARYFYPQRRGPWLQVTRKAARRRAEESQCGTERPQVGAQARHVASFAVSRPTLAVPGEERQRGRNVGQVGKKATPRSARRLCSSPT